jgi:hypothetical protein
MSISPAHSEAARGNGAISNGPATAEGKFRSSQNSAKHRLFGATTLLSPEDQIAFNSLSAGLVAEFQPETSVEDRFVREMIDAEWRLQRVRAHSASLQETRMRKISSTPTMDDAAEAFCQLATEGPSLSLLARYETQFRRQFDKSFEMLLDYRLRTRTDPERIQRALVKEQIRFINDYVNAPMPGQTGPDVEAESETEADTEPANCDQPCPDAENHAPTHQPLPHAHAAAACSSAGTNLPNEPSDQPAAPRRFINIFKKRGSGSSNHRQN